MIFNTRGGTVLRTEWSNRTSRVTNCRIQTGKMVPVLDHTKNISVWFPSLKFFSLFVTKGKPKGNNQKKLIFAYFLQLFFVDDDELC